jgi:hypothetical protein
MSLEKRYFMDDKIIIEGVEKPKKERKFLKKLLMFIVGVIIFIIILGFLLPGFLWTRSLGIKYTKEDYDSMLSKLEYIKDNVPSGDLEDYEYVYGPLKDVNVFFTSEELTAFFNYNRPDYYALKNVQVRINDNTIEASGSANVDYFLNTLLEGKYTKEEIKDAYPALGLLPNSVNLYLNIEGSIDKNLSSLKVKSIQVQGITLPSELINSEDAISFVTTTVDNGLSKYEEKSGTYIKKMAIENNKLLFEGKTPSSLNRVEND